MVWAGEGSVDLLTGEIHQWGRIYTWRSLLEKWPEVAPGTPIYRYYPVYFESTSEADAERTIRRALAGMRFIKQNETTVTRDS